MKYRWIAGLLCCLLLISGCKKQAAQENKKEESAGTGYGVSQKSALIMQDFYELRPGTLREAVETALGSPQSFTIAESNVDTYRLSTGESIILTYNEKDKIEKAVYTDISGRRQDFFGYLNELGILTNYRPSEQTEEEEQPQEEQEEPQAPQETPSEDLPLLNADGGYFSSKRYSYDLVKQIVEKGAERETVVSALGKPNSFSSVTFEKDSYLVDVYAMEDGSTLYLDYGYNRVKLRAVRKVSGTEATDYIGSWGQEKKPSGYIRNGRNRQVFSSLKKNMKPSEVYRLYGAPDWLEGNVDRYRDAYQLRDGGVFYLDFGENHNSLSAAVMYKADGTIVNYTLR